MGFTLVEMMVTVAVIGLAATAVVLAAPDPTPRLPVEAVMFDPVGLAEPARLSLSRDRARATVTVDLAGEVRLDD